MKSIGAAVIGLCKYIGTSPYTAAIKEIAQTIAGAWTFTSAVSITRTAAGTALTATSTDAGAASGPDDVWFRDSVSPLAGDFLTHWQVFGRDSAGNTQLYGGIYVQIIDPISTSEDSLMGFRTVAAGSNYDWAIQSGAWFAQTATGGAQGVGTINAKNLYVDGVAVLTSTGLTNVLIVQDQKASGTDGGTATSGSWQTRTLNTTVQNGIAGASLAANQITLPAGTYTIEWSAPCSETNRHQSRLRNVTDGSTPQLGSSSYAHDGTANNIASTGQGYFTIAGAKAFEIQHQVETTHATTGYGVGSSFGVNNVYTSVKITKVA